MAARTSTFPLSREQVEQISNWQGDPEWARERRLTAWEIAEATPLPDSSTDEPWRRTNLRRAKWKQMVNIVEPQSHSIDEVPEALYRPLIGEQQGGLLVFVDGVLVRSELSETIEEQGVIFTDLQSATIEHPDILEEWWAAEAGDPSDGKFAAIHSAIWTHGVVLIVPDNTHVELPLHSVEYSTGTRTTGMHILVVLGENASATYLHESASPEGEDLIFHTHATELTVGDNSNLRYVALQNWGQNVYNFGHQRGRVGQNAQLDWVDGQMGTRLTKIFMNLDLDGDDSFGRISGLYFAENKQHLDLDTQQNHHALRTTSDLLYKGALQGDSRSVWQGMIMVDPGAQQTDGFQANRNLILERTARADSIPGLEIAADDVACTHAATIGKLDETELFYLMSRGIPREAAMRMVVLGFFDPVLQRIPFEEVQERLRASIEAKLQNRV
ncbi:MAG: Fe-S cluster assembly protein SufD [Anaerolineae bacterium]